MSIRYLTPVEKNHLLRFGFDLEKIDSYGETPVEYITERAFFAGRDWKVTPAVLIPRLETEELVEKVTQEYVSAGKNFSLLEVGTGSGALGLSVLVAAEEQGIACQATLTDISAEALAVARENSGKVFPDGLGYGKLEWVQSNLLQQLGQVRTFDVCVANLPYIPHQRIQELASSVKDFEPIGALDGGKDGFELIAALLVELRAKNFSGKVFLEVDDTHTLDFFHRHFPELPVVCEKDQFGRNRFARINFSVVSG